MDFELCFKVHNLVYVQPKRIKLGQTINLNVMVLIYRLLQISNSPQFPAQLRNGLYRGDWRCRFGRWIFVLDSCGLRFPSYLDVMKAAGSHVLFEVVMEIKMTSGWLRCILVILLNIFHYTVVNLRYQLRWSIIRLWIHNYVYGQLLLLTTHNVLDISQFSVFSDFQKFPENYLRFQS